MRGIVKSKDKAIFSITLDVDWVNDEILEDYLKLLDDHKIKATLFCTHKIKLKTGNHELALHPNLRDNHNYLPEIKKLKRIYPKVKGVRAHGMVSIYNLHKIYHELGLKYESNWVMYNCHGIKPVMMVFSMLELPIFFMDGTHLVMCKAKDPKLKFGLKQFDLEKKGLKVFGFHPIHLYLNTSNYDQYYKARDHFNQTNKLSQFINEGYGLKTLFTSLIDYLEKNKIKSYTLSEINNVWRKENK